MRDKKYNILELREYRKQWEDVHTDLLSDKQKEVYAKRKKAVDMYIDDIPIEQISKLTGVSWQKISGYMEKCLKVDVTTGMQYGYTGLLQYKRLEKKGEMQLSNLDTKTRGSFSRLLLTYPTLVTFIKDNYYRTSKKTLEKNISANNLHQKFLCECKRLKIQDYEYPFNTTDKARRTFYNYLKQLDIDNSDEMMKKQNKNSFQKYASTGIGIRKRPIPLAPFSVVQLDGHKIDMLYTVEVVNKHGEVIRMPAMRMWLIAVIDVATRTIIGYSLTTSENYNQTDVLRAIRSSIIPKKPINFKLSGLKYPENYGFPSLAIPETEWAMPDIIMLDNAKSHLAENVINKLCSHLYCSLNFGSVATPETRGIVERVFKTLEDNGYHRMVSTTGSNINDVRRTNAERDAVKYQVTYDDIVQLTEYIIATYNNSPHSALDNQTPLECMERRIADAGMMPCIADADMKQRIFDLTNMTEIKTIRGSIKHGKRPYITYKGVEYRNDILSQSMGLIGQKIIIEINPDDISRIKGFFEDGTCIGILSAVGEWGKKRHSLKTREEALRLSNYNKQKNNPFYAPLTELENELNLRAETERRARTKAARLRVEQNKELKIPNTKTKDNIIKMPISSCYEASLPTIGEDDAIKKKLERYTPEEWEAIKDAGSLQAAYEKGLI